MSESIEGNNLTYALDRLFGRQPEANLAQKPLPLHTTILGGPEHANDISGLSADVAVFMESGRDVPSRAPSAVEVDVIRALGIASYNNGLVVVESHWARQDDTRLPHKCVVKKCLALRRDNGIVTEANTAKLDLLVGKSEVQLFAMRESAEEVANIALRNMLEASYVRDVPQVSDGPAEAETRHTSDQTPTGVENPGGRISNNLLLAGSLLSPIVKLAVSLGGYDGGPFKDAFLRAAVRQKIHALS